MERATTRAYNRSIPLLQALNRCLIKNYAAPRRPNRVYPIHSVEDQALQDELDAWEAASDEDEINWIEE